MAALTTSALSGDAGERVLVAERAFDSLFGGAGATAWTRRRRDSCREVPTTTCLSAELVRNALSGG